jgi:DNA replication and repair protein RecF
VTLSRLHISNVRNLLDIKLDNLTKVNVFYGANGSGKTSVLEAIHLLGMARSFRGSNIRTLITHELDECTVHGVAIAPRSGKKQTLGVQRVRNGTSQIKVAGAQVRSVAELVEHLPLQLINSDGFDLLTGSPSVRRQFMNWGVFHVEHRFFAEWQRFQKCIKQRNIVLRRGKIDKSELSAWSRDLAVSGERINAYRHAYIAQLAPLFLSIMTSLMPYLAAGLELRYRQGWDKTLSFDSALMNSLQTDQDQGYTHVGPQRADIKVLTEGYSAAETLSRGQQKLVVCGLKLAQGMLLAQLGKGVCTYLIDDLPSELDKAHCERVCGMLSDMDAQVFITCVEKDDIVGLWPRVDELTLFHVEQGNIAPLY